MRSIDFAKAVRFSFVIAAAGLIGGLGAAAPSTVALNTPPELISFEIKEVGDGIFTASGQVDDNYPEGCFVQFGGFLHGYYAVVMEDGSFSTYFEAGYGGRASAEAIDDAGQGSNVLWNSIQ